MSFSNAFSAFTRSTLHRLQDTVRVTPHTDPNVNYYLHTLYLNTSQRFPPNTLQREHYTNIASDYIDFNDEMYY